MHHMLGVAASLEVSKDDLAREGGYSRESEGSLSTPVLGQVFVLGNALAIEDETGNSLHHHRLNG